MRFYFDDNGEITFELWKYKSGDVVENYNGDIVTIEGGSQPRYCDPRSGNMVMIHYEGQAVPWELSIKGKYNDLTKVKP